MLGLEQARFICMACTHWGLIFFFFNLPLYFLLEKAMATHSSTLAWQIPWTEEPGRLQSMGLLGVGHDWATSLSLHFSALKKEMATHSNVLVWRIPGTAEPGGLPSVGSHRVGHDWGDLAAAAAVLSLEAIDLSTGKSYADFCLARYSLFVAVT